MSVLDLSSYAAVQTCLFVRMDIPTLGVLKFSDYYKAFTINSESYTALGSLMSVSETVSELKLSASELNIQISGIPTANMDAVLDYNVKGAPVRVYRVFFDPTTGVALSIAGNPANKFIGIINNYNLVEEFDDVSKNSSVSINFACTSEIGIIQNRVSGRRTNPDDQKKWYPLDISMDRVPTLVGANFNFGAPLRSNA